MKKFIVAPLLAAVAMFVWGFIYWGAPHLVPYRALSTVSDPDATTLTVEKLFPASGTYLLPSPLLGEEKMSALARRSPSVEIHLTKESFVSSEMGKVMVGDFIYVFVFSLLLSVLLCGVAKAFERWTCRVKFCAFLGDLAQAIW
jgi:hypothetical protein